MRPNINLSYSCIVFVFFYTQLCASQNGPFSFFKRNSQPSLHNLAFKCSAAEAAAHKCKCAPPYCACVTLPAPAPSLLTPMHIAAVRGDAELFVAIAGRGGSNLNPWPHDLSGRCCCPAPKLSEPSIISRKSSVPLSKLPPHLFAMRFVDAKKKKRWSLRQKVLAPHVGRFSILDCAYFSGSLGTIASVIAALEYREQLTPRDFRDGVSRLLRMYFLHLRDSNEVVFEGESLVFPPMVAVRKAGGSESKDSIWSARQGALADLRTLVQWMIKRGADPKVLVSGLEAGITDTPPKLWPYSRNYEGHVPTLTPVCFAAFLGLTEITEVLISEGFFRDTTDLDEAVYHATSLLADSAINVFLLLTHGALVLQDNTSRIRLQLKMDQLVAFTKHYIRVRAAATKAGLSDVERAGNHDKKWRVTPSVFGRLAHRRGVWDFWWINDTNDLYKTPYPVPEVESRSILKLLGTAMEAATGDHFMRLRDKWAEVEKLMEVGDVAAVLDNNWAARREAIIARASLYRH